MEKIYSGIINYARGPDAHLIATACLDSGETQRVDRLRLPLVKASFLAGRSLIRGLLAPALETDPAALKFEIESGGKPRVSGQSGIHCGISHSHHLATAAWGFRDIGIDIEYQRPGRDIAGIAEGFYGQQEQALLKSAGPAANRVFHLCWTLKEAWLKLSGDGLAGFGTVPQFLPGDAGGLSVILPADLHGSPLAAAAGFRFQARELLTTAGEHYFWALAFCSKPGEPPPELIEDQRFIEPWSRPPVVWESGFIENPAPTLA